MVDASELIALNQSTDDKGLKLANVVELFESGTVKIQFYGEESPSEKEYSYLASYTPSVNDTVLMIPMADTYIVLGKILYGVVIPEIGYVTVDQLYSVLTDYAKTADLTIYVKTQDLTDALTSYAKTSDLSAYVKNTTLNSTLNGYATTNHYHSEIHNSSMSQYGVDVAKQLNGTPCFSPTTNGVMACGSPSNKFSTFYGASGTINTSDERLKNSISKLPAKYKKLILSLETIIFKYNDGTSGRFHAGIGARKTEKIMKKLGITLQEFGGIVKYHPFNKKGKELNSFEYGVRMEEFIAPIIGVVQDHEKTINDLLKRVEKLEGGKK